MNSRYIVPKEPTFTVWKEEYFFEVLDNIWGKFPPVQVLKEDEPEEDWDWPYNGTFDGKYIYIPYRHYIEIYRMG